MAKFVEVTLLATSDEGEVELVRKEREVISLITSDSDEEEGEEVEELDSDEEVWRERKRRCPFILWECAEEV